MDYGRLRQHYDRRVHDKGHICLWMCRKEMSRLVASECHEPAGSWPQSTHCPICHFPRHVRKYSGHSADHFLPNSEHFLCHSGTNSGLFPIHFGIARITSQVPFPQACRGMMVLEKSFRNDISGMGSPNHEKLKWRSPHRSEMPSCRCA